MLNGRAACRAGHPCEPEDPKEVLHCGVLHGALGLAGVAARVSLKPSTLADMVNPHEPDWPPMRAHAGILAATADHPVLARYYAELQGGVFYPLPTGNAWRTTADSVREFGEFLQQYGEAASDARITAIEAAGIEQRGQKAIAAIAAVISDAKRRAGIIAIPIASGGQS